MSDERPDALLKSALEKIVYFEARAEQLSHELTSTREELEHLKRELVLSEDRELALRREVAGLEVRVGRMASERDELSRLNQALRTERSQLLGKLLEVSRIRASDAREEEDNDGLGIDLASFISQLRSEALARPAEVAAVPAQPVPAYPWPQSEPQRSQAVEVAPAPALAVVAASAANVSPVMQHAQRLFLEGRLAVSPGQMAELSGGGDETLFGFSVRELSAPDATSRVRAAERLKALGQPAAAPALATALHGEKDPTVQVALLAAFAEVGKEEGVLVVSPLLASSVPEVRIASLKALLSLSPQEAAPHLAQAVKDPDRSVRRRASLLALGLEGEGARRLGEEAIHDPDAEVRSLAALALGAGSGEHARMLLLEALKDSEVRVRRSASQSLSRILGQDVSAVVDMDEGRRRREIRRLAALPVQPVRASLLQKPPARAAAPVAAPAPVAPAVVQASVPAAPPAPSVRPAPAPSLVHRAAVPAAVSAPARGVAQQAVRTAAASPAQAQPVSRPTARQSASPVEALCGPLMSEIRVAIRGRSLGELATGISAPPELAEEALTLLVARGAIIRRGHKYFAA
ncbi:HEAT repeat domain-containing protein [Archangium lansingense]|uniref:HEAT repeat domain-containing protein n=1 Tax=Archangium lansingense TaxID=2995310 RepID=A0ABT3ZWQ2_9BACT|nr:HEAT repeat domain-containing protein [Archangium lansinium]MCY1073829.1 HEAT repeat domain-containing protein [Archangium lansinium]